MFFINTIFALGVIFLLLSIINSFSNIFYDMIQSDAKSKRLKQMKSVKQNKNLEFKDIMDAIASPTNRSILPRLKRMFPSIGKVDHLQIDRDLRLIGWDDTFTPESYIGAIWGLRCIGAPVAIFSLTLGGIYKYVGFFIGAALIAGLEYWVHKEVKEKKQELFADFPDFIRIVSGYLSADIPLVQSISDSIKYVGDAWVDILRNFVIDCDTRSVDFALERMKNTVDIFEVKEFVSLIRLTLEQGGNAKEGFLSQAEKISELQKNQLVLKVGKRKMLAQATQAPLLLADMIILCLPTIRQAMDMFGEGGGMSF